MKSATPTPTFFSEETKATRRIAARSQREATCCQAKT
jgi:hypothetical protein